MTDEVASVRRLREERRHEDHLSAARALVAASPDDVHAQIEAAYALDRAGDEQQAITHYDAAHRLGVPAPERRHFIVGYGSTLRNVGRHEEAVEVLSRAVASDPGYAPFTAFLALALDTAGQPRLALATMLGCALDAAAPGSFDGYERALAAYRRALERGSEG